MHRLTREQARQVCVRAQLLGEPRPVDALEVVGRLTLVQHDQTTYVAPSADLVLWSRLGPTYHPEELRSALQARVLVDLRGMVRPAEDVALYRAEMAAWPGGDHPWERECAAWVEANDACRRDVLARLEAEGPLTAKEIPDSCAVPWRSSGWTNDRNVLRLLDFMESRGEVAVAGRRRERLWDLAERVYPDDPPVPLDKALEQRSLLWLRSQGLVRPRELAVPVGEPAVVEGVRGRWLVDPEQLGRGFEGRAALLSPLDRLVFDRKKALDVFGFDYQLEMYKPAAKRRWGYWALPVLWQDRLVGKLDCRADAEAGVLRVDALHDDVGLDREATEAVQAEVESLASWLDLAVSG